LCGHAADVSDEASAIHIHASYGMADTDHIIRCGDTAAGIIAYGDIEVAGGVVRKHEATNASVSVADCVVNERTRTNGGIEVAGGVVKECSLTSGSVVITSAVAKQRIVTGGCILVADGVEKE
jgi:hypothetical protein